MRSGESFWGYDLGSVFTKASISLLLAALTAGCQHEPQTEVEKPDLILLQTGRLRGNVYPESIHEGKPLQYYLKLAAFVEAVRREAAGIGAEVLLVDQGDSLSGSFAAYATGGANMVDFFNLLRYDALFLGNLDADLPDGVIERLRMPVFSPFESAPEQALPAGARTGGMVKAGKLQALLAANFYGDLDPATAPHRFPAWIGSRAGVRPTATRDYSQLLAKGGGADIKIFSWMKFESPDQPPEGFLSRLKAWGFDLILAHRVYSGNLKDVWSAESLLSWEPPVAQNILRENRGFTIGRTDLKRGPDGWRVLSSRLVAANSISGDADPQLVAAIEKHADTIRAANAEVADLPETLSSGQVLALILRALTAVPGVDIVAYSPNSVRGELPEGKLRAGQVFEVLPWTAPLAILTLNPDEVQRALAATPLSALIRAEVSAEAEGSLRLATSRFTAEVIRLALGLPGERIELVEGTSEFEFFRQAFSALLAERGSLIPEGWRPADREK